MPTTRTPIKRRQRSRITPEIVALFVRCEEMRAGGIDWDSEGFPRQEFLQTERKMRQLLGLPPWAFTPCEVEVDERKPAYLENSGLCSAPTWEVAQQLRRELLEAAGRTERTE